MKNQYFGDINDYTKYGLLRCFADAGLRIGVNWMMTPSDGRSDGRKIKYLSDRARWRRYDPLLFDTLAREVLRSRSVLKVQNGTVLPNTTFFGARVPDSAPLRDKWFQHAQKKLSDTDLVFFDPDNGIEVGSVCYGKRNCNKYVFWTELGEAWNQGKTLLVFQHFPRQKHNQYALDRADQLRGKLSEAAVVPLMTSNVLYLLAYPRNHHKRIESALDQIKERWADQIWSLQSPV